MSTTMDVLRDRATSVCAGLGFVQAQTPFDFELQPTGAIDGVFRLEVQSGSVIGGFNFSEERTDLITVWVARKQSADPTAAYGLLVTDATSLRAAVIRDGHASGEYFVPAEGAVWDVAHEDGREYAVLELTIPANYEAEV
jgi:hypothetical protein